MAAIAAGFGRAHIVRVVRGSRRHRYQAGGYATPHDFVPASTADLWRAPRRLSR